MKKIRAAVAGVGYRGRFTRKNTPCSPKRNSWRWSWPSAESSTSPTSVDSVRIAPVRPRGMDVNVPLDLMIHDIDIPQTIEGPGVREIHTVCAPVFTGEEDIANVRVRFENGCVANVPAGCISLMSERKMRIFQADAIRSS